MKEKLRIALAQINSTVGDFSGNLVKVKEYIRRAEEAGSDIVAFPELAITGYPPEDLLLKPKFIQDNLDKIRQLAQYVNNILVVAGFVDRRGKNIYNAAAVIYDAKIRGIHHKILLPNYGVFDEKRYFTSGQTPEVFKIGPYVFGVNICEDIWHKSGPTALQAGRGAGFIININASPYHLGKIKERERVVQRQARANNVFVAYANLVGGQDELVFDGQSMVVDNKGSVINRAEAFKEDLLITDIEVPLRKHRPGKKIINIADKLPFKNKIWITARDTKPLEPEAEVYQALLLGLGDYVIKNGFKKVIVGLSGGIDSALVATLAADALSKDDVIAVFMPSRYSSGESEADARALAQNLGIKFMSVPIEQIYRIYLMVLEPHFFGLEKNIAEENLQARIRGNLLMALSNKFGWLVLTTGNKSEMSCGYATLYGDMAGGFAMIKDVPKTFVYKLSQYRNSLGAVIPQRIFTKEPTAELKPNQKDTDTLPAYEILDPILKAYVEDDKDFKEIVSSGFNPEVVEKVTNLVDKGEYKRRQSPPGIKITPRAFGKDRRIPITNKYRG